MVLLDESGLPGASPDRLVEDGSVLGAKCPRTQRNLTIEEALEDRSFCLEKKDPGKIQLKENHVY